MLSENRKRSVRRRLLAEKRANKWENPLSLNSFVTFAPFVVRNPG